MVLDLKNEKDKLRKKMSTLRGSADVEFIQSASQVITEQLLSLPESVESKLIMCYMSFRTEVVTHELIKKLISLGKRVVLPVIEPNCTGAKSIVPYEVIDLEKDLQQGYFGILEPRKDIRSAVSPQEIDMIIVPGIAFDKNRQRVGYGAGYYDGFLNKLRSDTIKIGIGFDFQVVEKIPFEKHDVALDVIITEKRRI